MGTELLVCVAGAGHIQCPFHAYDRSADPIDWQWNASNRKARELAYLGNRIDCCRVRFNWILRLSNRNRGCGFSLCPSTIVAMGDDTVRCGWVVFFSPSYRLSGVLRCLGGARSLRDSITCREY